MDSTDPSPTVLTSREARVLRALGQALFPRDKQIGVDAADVKVADYIDDWLSRVGPTERAQFHALIHGFDVGFPVWSKEPGARFDRARPDDRREYIASWEQSSSYIQRMLWEGLRSMLLFAYVDAPDVHQAIGIDADQATEVATPDASVRAAASGKESR